MSDDIRPVDDYVDDLAEDVKMVTGQPPLHVNRTVQGHTVLVEADGEIDLSTAPMLDQQLAHAEAATAPPAPVIVDLTRVAFLGARSLGALVHHHHRCHLLGSTLRIVAQQRAVLRPIQIADLDTTLCVFPSTGDALRRAA